MIHVRLSPDMMRRTAIGRQRVSKRVIAMFEAAGGKSTHSAKASTLSIIIEYCEHNEIPYTLHARPGKGYFIEKIK